MNPGGNSENHRTLTEGLGLKQQVQELVESIYFGAEHDDYDWAGTPSGGPYEHRKLHPGREEGRIQRHFARTLSSIARQTGVSENRGP